MINRQITKNPKINEERKYLRLIFLLLIEKVMKIITGINTKKKKRRISLLTLFTCPQMAIDIPRIRPKIR